MNPCLSPGVWIQASRKKDLVSLRKMKWRKHEVHIYLSDSIVIRRKIVVMTYTCSLFFWTLFFMYLELLRQTPSMFFELVSQFPALPLILKLEQNWIQLVWTGRGTGPWSPDRRTFSGVRFLLLLWPCSQTSPQQHPHLQSYPTEWPNLEQMKIYFFGELSHSGTTHIASIINL